MGAVTDAIVEFVGALSLQDVDSRVLERVRIHILDSLGLALAGAVSPASGILQAYLKEEGLTGGGATVIGTKLRAPPRFAALANGAAIHADNFDDTAPHVRADRTGGIHVSAAMLPVALALGETRGSSGRDIVVAYLAGAEIAARLNHAVSPRHYSDGFHVTATLNLFGAAMTAAVLLQLDAERIRHVLGIAASLGSGVRRNFGTMTEIMHPGHAAEQGIVAAQLAARGFTASADALDGTAGYLAAAAGGFDPAEIVGKLGSPWVFISPGVWIKPHPNGSLIHPAVSCLLDLLGPAGIRVQDIDLIRVRTNRRILNTLPGEKPQDINQARFSMSFALAVTAVRRKLGLADVTVETLASPEIREVMNRVEHLALDEEGADFTNVTSFVEVVLRNGQCLAGRADHARGSSARPFDWADVTGKFFECAHYGGYSTGEAAQIRSLTRKIEQFDRLDALYRALSRQGNPERGPGI